MKRLRVPKLKETSCSIIKYVIILPVACQCCLLRGTLILHCNNRVHRFPFSLSQKVNSHGDVGLDLSHTNDSDSVTTFVTKSV